MRKFTRALTVLAVAVMVFIASSASNAGASGEDEFECFPFICG